MRLIYNDLGAALSVKSCYSKFMNVVSLLALLLLLSLALVMEEVDPTFAYSEVSLLLTSPQNHP